MAEETKENEKQLLLDLQQSNEVIDLFGSMQLVNKNTVVDKLVETELTKKGKLRANEMCFYRVKQLSFDEDYPHREAFENVLLSMCPLSMRIRIWSICIICTCKLKKLSG